MPQNQLNIQADPSKRFFIDMLTRDIKLIDCILDLVDNSIDSILHQTKFDPMKGLFTKSGNTLKKYEISIEFDKSKFTISDNSAGVDKKTVSERAFRFGASASPKKGIGLSVYGIGMKRSFLKIGKQIKFESLTTTGKSVVDIDVDKWLKEEEWDFNGNYSALTKNKKTGTYIKITKLNENISSSFENKIVFQKKLLEKIQPAYGIFIENGLVIKVNGEIATPSIPTVSQSKNLQPSVETFTKNGVRVKVIAGVTSEDEKKSNGWFIFCNGRMILSGDKTEMTGWGNGLRKFHASTNRFVGFVYFESADANSLPWATTKDGVDYESDIYQYTLQKMNKIAKPVVDFLVKQYQKNQNKDDMRELIADSKEVSVGTLKNNESFRANFKENKDGKEVISYKVDKKDIDKALELLGNKSMSYSKLGEKTFYYFIEHEE